MIEFLAVVGFFAIVYVMVNAIDAFTHRSDSQPPNIPE